MDSSLLVASPFLQDPLDFHSPSPQSNQFDISPNDGSPYDSFDYQPEASSHFPHTPSYNGSYQNSPYSVLSDLPPTFDNNDLGLYPSELSAPAIPEEYDPSDFDVPTSSAHNVLSFSDSFMPSLANNPQVSVTPADYNESPFDHSSPASSNGQEDGRRSRASSTSSYMHSGSPHLDLPQNLANLTFDSPNWQNSQLPQNRQPSPPSHKAPSPPQLVIPSSPSVTANDSPPTINAPDGDGVMGSGPQLHIVPATPISGGGGNVGNVPFQTTLANLQQQSGSGGEWDPSRQHLTAQGQNQNLQSQFTDQRAFNYSTGSDHDQQQGSPGMAFASGESQMHHLAHGHGHGSVNELPRQQHSMSPLPQQRGSPGHQQSSFLIPQQMARSRSLSDTSTRPPVWDTLPSGHGMMAPNGTGSHQGVGADFDGSIASHSHDSARGASLAGTVNMNDVLPGPSSASSTATNTNPTATGIHSPPSSAGLPRHPSSAGPLQSSFTQLQPQHPSLPQHHSFGPSGSVNHFTAPNSADFLSPHDSLGAAFLRRSKSDSNRGHRISRSEDLRSNDFLRPDMMYPPASASSRELIQRQYLHPTESMPLPSIASRGHHRRSSSGSRERSLIGGWSSAASSQRPSPYPSPSASPRPGYGALPEMVPSIQGTRRHMTGVSLDMGMGMHHMGGMNGMNGMGGGMGVGGGMNMNMGIPSHVQGMNQGGPGMSIPVNTGDAVVPLTVSKVNVTTPSTADASHKRRKQPANFACPVPGCGSTFTRHFNLKGHLRSHAEEKPYQCKWPGCGKGFARQHDCKRHEQLHLNIRPYPCEGCKKNFARMDALNRHLRSEGGAECRKIQDELTATSSGTESANNDSAAAAVNASNGSADTTMKPDPDSWTGMNGGGIVM
ncbi:hypothetical protein QCA50_014300 [Cerrena zonata]|uniref:C2H2-type domain-containing protein n=3 Tax=Polyporales TaxID=5303 RepID=A0AAW0FMD5_9APHY